MIRFAKYILLMIFCAVPCFAQINVYSNFEAGSNGNALSTTILNNGTACNTSGGTWSLSGNAATQMAVATAAENALLGAVTACGSTYPAADGTRGITYNLNDGGAAGGRAELDWTRTNTASLGIWVKIGVPTSDTNYHSMLSINDGTGDFVSLMINSGNIYLESGACPNGTPVSCGGTGSFYAYTQNVWYWVTEKYVKNGTGTSMHSLNIYDASGNLLSAQTKPSQSGDSGPNFICIGKIGDTGSPASLIYYDNFMADTNGNTFPILPGTAPTYPWSGIVPNNGCNEGTAVCAGGIDWSQTGIPGGIPSGSWTQCGSTVSSTGSDQSSSIQTLLNACSASTYLLLNGGTFTVNTTVNIPDHVVLRGSGANLTTLNVHGSSQAPVTLGTGSISYTGVNITSGATAGSTSIVVASATGMSVGKYLVVSETNVNTGNSYVTNNGGEGACTWCDGWSTNGARARGQIVEITSVAGTTIGFTPALYNAYTSSPTVVVFTASEKYAGVENLQVYMNNSGYTDAFFMGACAYCWVKGVEVNYADGDYAELDWGYRDEIRDSYFSNAYNHSPGGTDASIFPVYKTSASKIENNIVERCHACIFPSRGAAGNVIAYNYVEGAFDNNGTASFAIGGVGMHGAHPQFNLIEGNVFPLYYPDQVWGSSSNNTLFRNWVVGTTKACNKPANGTRGAVVGPCVGQYQAARGQQIAHISTYANLIGDVVGSALMQGMGLTNTGSIAYPSSPRSYDTVAYGYSWGYGESSDDGTGSGCGGGTAPCNGTQAFNTGFIHGEYNNITSAITWAAGVTHTLPSSFYLSTQPSWWGSVPYPAIGPDVTGGTGPGAHTNLIPAQNCYINVMGGSDGGVGSPLTFNASSCYSQAPPPPSPHIPIILGSLPNGTVGTPYSASLSDSGATAPVTWSVNPNIPGLALAAGTGVLSGTPSTPGTYNLTFTLVDSYVCGTSDPPGCTNTSNPYPLVVTIAGASVVSTYSMNTSPKSLKFTGAVGASIPCQTLTIDDTTPKSLPIAIASPQTWITATPATGSTKLSDSVCVKTAGLAAGTFIGSVGITATTPNNGYTVNNSPLSVPVTLTLAGAPALTISTSSLPNGTVGTAYTATLAATGGTSPYTWGSSGLPPGLTQSGAVISGTPTAAGTFTISESASDSSVPVQIAGKTFSVTIAAPPPSMTTACAWLADGVTWRCDTLTVNMPKGTAIKSVVTAGSLLDTNTGTHP